MMMVRFMRLILCIMLLGQSFITAGCNGAREVDSLGYILAIGVDKSEEEGMYLMTYEIAVPGAGGGEKKESKQSMVISLLAPSLAEGFNLVSSTIALPTTLIHIKALVVGEDLARQGVKNVIAPLMRYREYRGSMFMMVARGKAKDYIEASKKVLNISPAKYYEIAMASSDESGYYLDTSLHQFYIRLKSASAHPYALLVSLNNGNLDNNERNLPAASNSADKTLEYRAGDIPRKGGDTAEQLGTAVFKGDKMVGMLSNKETRMLALLLGDYSHGWVVVKDPLTDKDLINVNTRLGSKPDIKVKIVDGTPQIDIKILLEGDITNVSSGINYEEKSYLNLLENQVSQVVAEQMQSFVKNTQQMGVDVAGFGYYARATFKRYDDFAKYKWLERYPEAQVNIEVKTQIRRFGLMYKTYKIGGKS